MILRWIGLGIVLISFGLGWTWMAYESATDSALKLKQPLNFEINKGDSLKHIVNKLVTQGVLTKPFYFNLLVRFENAASRLKAGAYKILPGMTPRQLLGLMVEGREYQYSLVFIEGWTFDRILTALSAPPQLIHTLDGKSPEEIMALLGAGDQHAEGRFFPDTYFFTKGTTDLDILKRAFQKMDRTLNSEWENRADGLPLRTPFEALILASIVEKETAQADERPIIAGVFIRRLQKSMLLQTDPTVIYGMGKRFNGNLRRKDLRADTPYNTYRHKGLPPTPIAMPGAESIHAVLHPQKGNSLYFVARGNGNHVFSSTLKDHNRAVALFQKKRKRRQ